MPGLGPSFNLNLPGLFQVPEDVSETYSHSIWKSYPVNKRASVLALLTVSVNDSDDSYNTDSDRKFTDSHDLVVLMTQRSKSLRASPGLSALPGGKVDYEDEDEWTCALREAYEETGFTTTLNSNSNENTSLVFEKLGILPCYLSLGNDAVRVCVAYVEMPADNTIDSGGGRHRGVPLRILAPKLAPDEVELAYTISLKQALSIRPWYVQSLSRRMDHVLDHSWIFHEYWIELGTELELRYSGTPATGDHGTGSNTSIPEGTSSTKIVKGLTGQIFIDLARTMHPCKHPEMSVLPYVGSNRMVRDYLQVKKMRENARM